MTNDEMSKQITGRQFLAADGVDDWRPIWGDGWACAYFRTGSFSKGVTFVERIGALAAAAEHYPDVDLRPEGVTVRLFSGECGLLSRRDAELAREVSVAARGLAIPADPSRVQHVQVTIDATLAAEVRPFWCAVLGYDEFGDEDVFDPLRRGPTLSFQEMDVPRQERGRIHVDLYLPHDQARTRIAAAVAAGGHIVSDANAPGWWTLADSEGNEVDVAIWGID
ncbi:MAG: VOC family protein [Jatrophihabitans sp.]